MYFRMPFAIRACVASAEDYKKFIFSMEALGYEFDSRELVAADYGAPTTRKRWYAVFRRDSPH